MSRRPVVAIVTDTLYPYFKGGKEVRYHEIVHRLAQRSDVHVFTMKWWDGDATVREGGVSYHAISRRRPLYAGRRRSLTEAAWFGVASWRLVRYRFDVIEADHIPYAPLFVLRVIASARRRPLVVTWHEVWGRQLWCEYLGGAGEAAWWVERLAMLMPDEIVAASPETAARLRPYLRRRTRLSVAPNGLDLDRIRASRPAEPRTDLVFVGRLLAHKNVDLLVEAVALLRDRGQILTCRVVGTGPELENLVARAAALGVEHLVRFETEVDDQGSVYSLLKASDVFVFPSVREGFGISVLEAIACGLPVVTTNVPDNYARILVSTTGRGLLCDPSAADVADAIAVLLNDRGADVQPGMTWAELDEFLSAYDWDGVVRIVERALRIDHA